MNDEKKMTPIERAYSDWHSIAYPAAKSLYRRVLMCCVGILVFGIAYGYLFGDDGILTKGPYMVPIVIQVIGACSIMGFGVAGYFGVIGPVYRPLRRGNNEPVSGDMMEKLLESPEIENHIKVSLGSGVSSSHPLWSDLWRINADYRENMAARERAAERDTN